MPLGWDGGDQETEALLDWMLERTGGSTEPGSEEKNDILKGNIIFNLKTL